MIWSKVSRASARTVGEKSSGSWLMNLFYYYYDILDDYGLNNIGLFVGGWLFIFLFSYLLLISYSYGIIAVFLVFVLLVSVWFLQNDLFSYYLVVFSFLIVLVFAAFIDFVVSYDILILMLVYVSSTVVVYSWNYMNLQDICLFLLLLIVFVYVMFEFIGFSGLGMSVARVSVLNVICGNSLIMVFIGWEYLGVCSYGLINWWNSRVGCGIKAVLFNKFGDISFIGLLCVIYNYFGCFSNVFELNSIGFYCLF